MHKDFEEFIRLLNTHQVRYVIVGAFALAYHGYPRNTGDIDKKTFIKNKRATGRGKDIVDADMLGEN